MIKTVNQNKVFRTDEVETTALDNLDFEVKPGEFVVVMALRVAENPRFLIF